MSGFSKDVSVVIIPHYISSALESDGVKLSELAAIATNLTGRWDDINMEEITNNILDKMKDTLSTYDLNTLVTANRDLFKFVTGSNGNSLGGLSWVINNKVQDYLYQKGLYHQDDNTNYMDLINDLRLTNSNSMSELKNNGYELLKADKHIFIILHEGFSNVIVDGDKVNRDKLLLELVNCMFESFGEDAVHSTDIFKQYLRLVQN